METIMEILQEIQPDLDCTREDLIDGHLLDSVIGCGIGRCL